MYKKPTKSQQVRKLLITYTIMTTAVGLLVATLVFIMLGYRFSGDDRQIIQTGLVQFDSIPSDSIVEIDKRRLSGTTGTKSVVTPGQHEFAMWQEGYETWWKQLSITSGTVTWLDYARLIPKDKQVASVVQFDALHDIVFSPGGRFAVAQETRASSTLQLIDLRNSDDIRQTEIVLPEDTLIGYGDDKKDDAAHSYEVKEWDQNGRYILVVHQYDGVDEWLLVDREDAENTKNISDIVRLPIFSAQIAGTDGDEVYVLTAGTIRSVNLSNGELSRALASDVESFSTYGADIVTFVGVRGSGAARERVVGVVKRDSPNPVIIKSVSASTDVPISVKTARYYRQNYLAVSVGPLVEVYAGNYPTADMDAGAEAGATDSAMPLLTSFTLDRPVRWLQMSGNGRFIMAQDATGYRSFDLERKELSRYVETPDAANQPLPWLDNYSVWNVESNQLVLREFDGANRHVLSPAAYKYGATFSPDNQYLYTATSNQGGATLHRLTMILN